MPTPLNHPVVKIPSNSVPVIEDTERPNSFVQPKILDRHPSCKGESLRQRHVLVSKSFGTHLVGEIEIPEDIATHLQGHAEKGSHRWMVLGKPVAVGMLADSVQSQWHGIGYQKSENASTTRTGADDLLVQLFQPHGQELFEAGALFIEHTQGTIASVDQRTRFGDQISEQFW
jgi:hypothetical protein